MNEKTLLEEAQEGLREELGELHKPERDFFDESKNLGVFGADWIEGEPDEKLSTIRVNCLHWLLKRIVSEKSDLRSIIVIMGVHIQCSMYLI
ncbi:MAG: hypothetical protein D3923_03415 [Candidatus Electrothrix sp. AR3]|nr:hypothetical protein [Candidatus Electrothrix sp. AR3]